MTIKDEFLSAQAELEAADRKVAKLERALRANQRKLDKLKATEALHQKIIIAPLESDLAIAQATLDATIARAAQFEIASKARMDALYATIKSEQATKVAARRTN